MLQQDERDYLYLIWKSEKSRRQYIVGRLVKNGLYEFYYDDKEIDAAMEDGFTPLLCFQDLNKVYTDKKLFPVFASRLPDKKRRDIQSILKKYNMEEYDEYMLLKRSGARLPIDNLEFIDPILNLDEKIERIFFVAGVRHCRNCNGTDCDKAVPVTRGDEIVLQREPDNEYDNNAVKMLDISGNLLGYIPRYYSESISKMLEKNRRVTCHVYHVDQNKKCNECIKAILKCGV